MKKFLVFIGLLSVGLMGFTQKKSEKTFSLDFEKFPKSMETYLERSNKSETASISKALGKVWSSEVYDLAEQKRIIELANTLVDIKVRTFPDMAAYVGMIIQYPESGMGKDQFFEWFGILENYASSASKKKKLVRLLAFSRTFFDTKSLFKTQSKSVDWRVDNYDFNFISESKNVKLVFDSVNLSCHAKGNFINLQRTSGVYDIFKNSWKGNGGIVTFERAGADPKNVWVDVIRYHIEMKRSTYTADSVVYHNVKFLREPLSGILIDKVLAKQKQSRTSYPRFQSYNVHIPIKNLVKEVDYMGGFAQQGARIIGTGTDEEPAMLTFEREGKPFMKITSKRFLMNINELASMADLAGEADSTIVEEKVQVKKVRNSIVSSKARVVIYLDGDSILHPGLKLNFYTDERLVNLVRVRGEMSETPYSNSYHKVEMRFELLNWKMDYPVIDFTTYNYNKDKGATFESEGFFYKRGYEDLMGASSWHPLARMKSCATKYDTNVVSLRDITGCLKLPVTGVEPMLFRYAVMGYVSYNKDLKEVTLLPKLFHQVAARNEKEDYDAIRVFSQGDHSPSRKNATLNLMNFDLTINGVSSITLSRAHSVKVLPDSGVIVMKRNRDFEFNGIISSGKVDFYGHGFSFNYDDFKLEMPVLDSMQIWATTKKEDDRGNTLEARVRTVVEELTGDLKIDHPNNKSGVKDLPKYPIFKSAENSYAYYDKKSVFNKVYDRDNFYFQLNPFEIDSLDKFKNEGIAFEGTLYSAGIFPEIQESLTLQEDYSLGFKQITPPEGYPLYGRKGTFKNELHLSDEGLKGNGYIHYLTSTAASEDFYFFPKEVQGITKAVEIEEQMAAVEYPNVSADTTKMRWLPYLDEYYLSSIKGKSPIGMFGNNVQHTGRLKYTPESLTGRGESVFEGAHLYSDSMVYSFYKIVADTSDFELASKSISTLDFTTQNVHAEIDFKERKGEFVSNSGASLTRFEKVMYQAYLDRFTWFMDEEMLEVSAAGKVEDRGANELQVEGAEFISINPHQDSLRFNARKARYDLAHFILEAQQVDLIKVADAEIIPNNGTVTIFEDALMERLDSSQIIANTEFRYHTIYDASTQITGRWKYESYGKYDYVDENNLTQILELTTVGVDSTRQSYANGIILASDDFSLSPMYRFRGNVNLKANRKNLSFDGYGKLVHECKRIPATWFSFDNEVDPNEVIIEINEEVIDNDAKALFASVIMPRDSSQMYGGFITKKRSYRDVPVSLATGYLEFDPTGRKYRISNLQKLNEQSFPGNYAALDINNCTIEGEGQLQLTQETHRVKVQAVGNYHYNSVNNKINLDATMAVDFLFDDGLMAIIIADARASELDPTEENPNYELTLREWMKKKDADEMISKIGLAKSVKIPEELRKTIFFNKLNLVWNESTNSYISQGQIGIGNVGKTPVNLLFDGGVELIQKRGLTDIIIYLEISPKKWYMFSYRASSGLMSVSTSNKTFMEKFREIKSDKRRIKREGELKEYQFMLGTKRSRSQFLLRLEDSKL